MSVGQLTSSAFVTCDPIPATVTVTSNVYTTVYTTTALAANPTTSWTATYTITEVCSGYPWEYKTHDIPPCFVPTTVYCEPCAQKTIPIICPAPSMTGGVVINAGRPRRSWCSWRRPRWPRCFWCSRRWPRWPWCFRRPWSSWCSRCSRCPWRSRRCPWPDWHWRLRPRLRCLWQLRRLQRSPRRPRCLWCPWYPWHSRHAWHSRTAWYPWLSRLPWYPRRRSWLSRLPWHPWRRSWYSWRCPWYPRWRSWYPRWRSWYSRRCSWYWRWPIRCRPTARGKPSTVVVASAPSLKQSLGLLCGIAMAAGFTVFA
ncbi:hypothetical protein K456DRAFT_626062 [Colletotrichum gloeosporioides 23]|nr:hypothetical protein K456DRAFT_626062 [Colletotrichum gloeosporioides 23]